MKISRVEIANVVGIARAEFDTPMPLTVIAGFNGTGKSSVSEAIAMAFTGHTRRVQHKKNYDQLIHDGAPKGRVSISFDTGTGDGAETAEFRLPKGEQSCNQVPGHTFLPYVLDTKLFSSLDADARRTMLFSLTGCKASGKMIVDKLINTYEFSEELVRDFMPMLAGGFVSAANEAGERAKAGKAVWKSITHEQWGPEKAADWTPAVPASPCPTPSAMESMLAVHQKTQKDLQEGRDWIVQQKTLLASSASYSARLAEAEELAALLPRRKKALEVNETDLNKWESKLPELLEHLKEVRAGVEPVQCPCCQADLRIVAGKLEKFAGLKADTKASSDAALAVTNARNAIDTLKKGHTNCIRDVQQAEDAVKQVKAIKDEKVETVDTDQLDRAEQAIAKLLEVEKAQRATFNQAQDLRNAYESLKMSEHKAKVQHEEITTWLRLKEVLSPEGIPATLLRDAMAPLNQSLSVLQRLCGWEKVEIDSDMNIKYGERLYGLRSESEQWRADALITLAVAQISGLRMAVLDRFDVLDIKSRGQFLGMCAQLGDLGAMETIIACGTLKEPMKKRADCQTLWITNGILED